MPEIKFSKLMTFLWLSLFCKTHSGPQLKVVSTMSVGYDHISLPETTKRWQFAYCTYFRYVRDAGCWIKKPGLVWFVLCSWARYLTLTEPHFLIVIKEEQISRTCVSTDNYSSNRLLGNLTENKNILRWRSVTIEWRKIPFNIMSLHNLF